MILFIRAVAVILFKFQEIIAHIPNFDGDSNGYLSLRIHRFNYSKNYLRK